MSEKKSTAQPVFKLLLIWFEGGNQAFLDEWNKDLGPATRSQSAPSTSTWWYALSISMILTGVLIWATQIPALIEQYQRLYPAQPVQVDTQKKSEFSKPSRMGDRALKNHFKHKSSAIFQVDQEMKAGEFEAWQSLMNRGPKPINQERLQALMFNQEYLSGFHGSVKIRIAVDALGAYQTHYVVQSSDSKLQRAVEKHINRLVFRPAIQSGRTTADWTLVEFEF